MADGMDSVCLVVFQHPVPILKAFPLEAEILDGA